ncbi:sialidase family protein [Amycolatopsis pithecellobii]|uniref:Exo-alpha-sialidase n=1 Tax=Amycolatopsis pithecellobii TaxID=664692 RepID=A0A6N7ZD97_9PSEU|nr:sialidase family protein [Amycolatopsis pithecellobii]MTD59649.1 exo-alpha-sialidase [Amycolatopsis pithecellobii]
MRKCAVLLLTLVLIIGFTPQAQAAGRQRLAVGSYPRLIRLEHGVYQGRIIAAVSGWDGNGPFAPVFESLDEGRSFRLIGQVRDPRGARGECCGTLFELPRKIGSLRAGTLLWAGSYGQADGLERRMSIRIWASSDGGRTWSFLSEAARSHNTDGVWEPEFDVDAGGTLWLHFADETEAPRFAQVLNRVGSVDGIHWGTKQRTLAIPPDRVRPGMPQVRKLPDGRYYFGYEICNYGPRFCDPYFKISPDGANFGDPSAPGTPVLAPAGAYFQHAQTVTLFPGGPEGTRILMVGQIYTDAKGKPLSTNGQVLLANDHFGDGPWYELPAPVQVPSAYDNFCPNYSSTLLPVDKGRNVLEIAADYENGVCTTYFAKGPAN